MAINKNPFKALINKIPAPFRNKYFLTLALFFAWLVFFDRHDVLTQYSLQSTLKELEADKFFYKEKIKVVKADKKDIESHKEKFAREHYYMKKSDEDVFIFQK